MQLRSSGFDDGATIPRRFTCDGENLSPPIAWSDPPEGTRSFALVCNDPDAPRGIWHHWAVYDIPADRTMLAEGIAALSDVKGLRQAINDFGRPGYGGPCPPHGHGPHHYHFRLMALSTDRLPLPREAACRDVEREARKHALAEASLVAVYER
ncbi:YbhB/YbcL family Raf kinase inhibitor-like protein [Chelatococcus sp. SYSU_G07232]|uniref:YbhB/YbcL family Raf kinase inhibitor-like protein n=1 Tax=Chelatococcus albus TaxID=3047466 RepID=A0ABT7AIJ1_9HYPH|nr:YbhB/YbcL family Raf kinase inhibitor-like protein [Chelatococcus sp. SYSU_G07232]MDJ1159196.1 YbhB/YbcL family Raf kinase inhibitor-like protein [Chelatococcus sp. SYSU_G07232]